MKFVVSGDGLDFPLIFYKTIMVKVTDAIS